MSVRVLGTFSIGSVVTGIGTLAMPALLQYLSDLASQVSALQTQVRAYASLQVSLPDPATLVVSLSAALAALPSQLSSIALGALPSVTAGALDIGAQLGALNIQLTSLRSLIDTMTAALSLGGLHAFAVDSTASAVGSELGVVTGGGMPGGGLPGARVYGVVLLTELPAVFAALSVFLRTS